MNSFRAVERAMAYEAERQYEVWQETGQQAGRRAQADPRLGRRRADVTRGQRHKEESSDYRYFPDPDLVPVTRHRGGSRARSAASLGELPAALRTRLEQTYGITPYDSDVLVNQGRALVDYYVELAELCGDGKVASNWVQQDVLRMLNEQQVDIEQFPVRPEALAELIGKVAGRRARHQPRPRGAGRRWSPRGKSAAEAMKALGIEKVDESALVDLCRELVAANPKIVADVKDGKVQAAGAFIGQAKKKNPNVNPDRVREICLELIGAE